MTQKEALEILKLGHNVFLTGKAGSGKTHLLNGYVGYLRDRKVGVAVTASTGIAATHIGGVTIHSWSGIGIKDKISERDIDELEQKKYLWKRFEDTRVLIIDEISMLGARQFEMVDYVCRAFKRNSAPFGGMQVILSGDFFQLPPISKKEGSTEFADQSKAWRDLSLKICYLKEQHRQVDREFLNILDEIRSNAVSEHSMNLFRGRYRKEPEGSGIPTKLYTHNIDVDRINTEELEKISGEKKEYETEGRGIKSLVEGLKKSCLAPNNLVLKKGAVVMFVKNNYEEGYVNGTMGKIVGFSTDGYPKVKTYDGKIITARPEEWRIEEGGSVKARISQIPLRLAWAITIHKSQGMSLDAAEIDLSKSFISGQGYVALSRLKSLSGLKLLGLNKIALSVDVRILNLDKNLQECSEEILASSASIPEKEKEKMFQDFIISAGGIINPKEISKSRDKQEKIPTYKKTQAFIKKHFSLEKIAKERGLKKETVISHIEKLLEGEEISQSDIEYLKPKTKTFQKNLQKIKEAFRAAGDSKLAPVRRILKNTVSYNDLRFARLFINI